ncbi:MAG: leucine-rich repeat domain-containing protein [Ruminococcus sp.]|nr:leucine-rich repeat domain-containing protein [Ruminococcus sp.]
MKKFIAAAVSAALCIGAVSAANVCAVTVDMGGITAEDVIVAASGNCGDNAKWDYTDGKLTITGTGNMNNWEMSDNPPWGGFKKKITSVEIDDRITSIGACAFADIPQLSSIKLPSGTKEIGRGAFDTCPKLVSVDVPASCEKIGMGAFRNCESLQKVTIRNSSCNINVDKETIRNHA